MLNNGFGDLSSKPSVQEDKAPHDFTPPQFDKMSRRQSTILVAALGGASNALFWCLNLFCEKVNLSVALTWPSRDVLEQYTSAAQLILRILSVRSRIEMMSETLGQVEHYYQRISAGLWFNFTLVLYDMHVRTNVFSCVDIAVLNFVDPWSLSPLNLSVWYKELVNSSTDL